MENSFIIENLLQQPEGPRLEFKAQLNIEAIAKTITAFINTQGGDLIVGVEDNKKLTGVENAADKANSIRQILVEQIKPTAPVSVEVINYKQKDLILISVWEGAKKPYLFKGTIYNRQGQSTRSTTVDKLSSLIRERRNADFNWERMPLLGAEISDLDISEMEKTVKTYREYKPDTSIEDAEDFLIQQGLIQNGNITNACMVLFGKNPVRFIPQSRIRLTVYPASSTGDYFLNDTIYEGNIFKNITEIINYLDITFGKSLIVDGVLRREKSNYPALAFREGLMNAIVHRDYNSVNGFMQIAVFANRTEISNFGGLPAGITTKDLRIEHHSILRNPDIAQICFIRKYIEMLGSGTLRMISDCKKNGFKAPEWLDKDNITKVIFHGVNHNKIDEGLNEGLNEGLKLKIEGVNEGVRNELNEILIFLLNNPKSRVPDIAEFRGKGVSTIERYLKILRENDLIEFKGSSKTGGYVVKQH